LLPPQDPHATEVRLHQLDYQELVAAGDELLRDPSADFVLLHMPIRTQGESTIGTTEVSTYRTPLISIILLYAMFTSRMFGMS
jgi:hypothetical protein